ncbi:MAG: HlyD family secretion protein [Novosphingobium sp.]|nr:HlyD family secretion protein [Novosphingobium sp.]MCP5402226.1 HlyD family secretion protein [Novosphingobium sp.]
MPAWIRKFGIGLLVLALIAAVAIYAYYDRHIRYFQETNDARIEADQVAISSKLAGYVRTVAVEDNQPVEQGALLVEIEQVDFRTRMNETQADIASARAAEGAAQASQLESRAAVAQARAALRSAQAGFAFADREVDRYRPLVAAGAEPQSRLSQLIAERDRAAAEVDAQKAALARAQQRVETLAAQAKSATAQLGAARVRQQAAANDLASTQIVTPIAGKVANRTVRVGQYVQPGQRLMTIVPADGFYVVANFKETQVGLMRAGQPAKISVDALPGVEFPGEVTSVTPGTGANFSLIKPENATGNFTKIVQRVPVRIRIDAGPTARKVLSPGMSLVVEVDTRASKDEIDAIRDEQEQAAQERAGQ